MFKSMDNLKLESYLVEHVMVMSMDGKKFSERYVNEYVMVMFKDAWTARKSLRTTYLIGYKWSCLWTREFLDSLCNFKDV